MTWAMKGRKTLRPKAEPTSLTAAQRTLISADMMAYADAWAHRYCKRGFCLGDLKQAAYLGLCVAALRYKNGASFKTFATYYIRKYLLMEMKSFL